MPMGSQGLCVRLLSSTRGLSPIRVVAQMLTLGRWVSSRGPLTPSWGLPHPPPALVLDSLVLPAEKYLSQEPGTLPYNISDDSVPEHKVALLKA